METTKDMVTSLTAGKMKLKIYPSKKTAGEAAALAVAEELRRLDQLREQIGVIFATGAAQFDTLEFLTSIPGLPWKKVRGFHLDEYVGLDKNHPASFRRFLAERLTQRVDMGAFFEMNGSAQDLEAVCREYIRELHVAEPQLCLLGIGENGHIAFNEPAEADFDDPLEMKIVTLDTHVPSAAGGGGMVPKLAGSPGTSAHVDYPDRLPCAKTDCLGAGPP